MRLPRFFVDADLGVGQTLMLPDDVSHHALRVLRLEADASVVLFNGRGGEHLARLTSVGKRATAHVDSFDPVERESSISVTLVQAWVAADKLDWIVEKAVELGANRVLLVPAARSVIRLDDERRKKRLAHLGQLAVSACAQCGRNRVPPIQSARDLESALAVVDGERLILRPDAQSALTATPLTGRAVAVLVGPEGGFDEVEVQAAARLGCRSVRLGPRVLRTETAGLVALAALQATAGDFAPC